MRLLIFFLCCSLLSIFLMACSKGPSDSAGEEEMTRTEGLVRYTNPDKSGAAPSQLFNEFKTLVSTVEKMSVNELNSLSSEAIVVLATPLSEILSQTVRFPDDALHELAVPMEQMKTLLDGDNFNKVAHAQLTSEIRQITETYFPAVEFRENPSADQIKQLFREWNRDQGFEQTCKLLFNTNSAGVFLVPGDNLAAVNSYCENSSLFFLSDGHYYRQFVENVRGSVSWIGSGEVHLDGMNSTDEAFLNGMRGAEFGWFEIENYSRFGIRAIRRTGTADVTISNMEFRNIGRDVNGQKHGAIKIEWARNIDVNQSYFENVTSAIRFLNSEGHLRVIENEALNPGRNFFQCDKCNGTGIRVVRNTMEHTKQFGTEKLEDFINIFESSGTETDYIQVSHNRARTDGTGEGVSETGSFIILGDHGGSYQIAEENIGVNPGNVGVGAAGGNHIQILRNKMYSDPIMNISNVAFYSFLTPPDLGITCSNHISAGNRAFWYCLSDACEATDTALLNKAYSPDFENMIEYCGLVNQDINADESVLEDSTLTAGIWDEF